MTKKKENKNKIIMLLYGSAALLFCFCFLMFGIAYPVYGQKVKEDVEIAPIDEVKEDVEIAPIDEVKEDVEIAPIDVINDNDPIYEIDVIDSIRVYPDDGRKPYTIVAKNSGDLARQDYKEIMELRQPDRRIYAVDDDTREVRIYPAPQFAYVSGGEWNYIEYSTTSKNILPVNKINMVSMFRRIFPVAYASESYIVGGGDGAVQGRSQATFSAARTAQYSVYNGNTEITFARSEKISANTFWYISRGFLPFNTAGLTGTIQGASLHIYNVAKSNTNNNSLALVQTTQADTSTLTLSDYTLCGSVNTPSEGAARVALSDIYDNAYVEIPLNSTGLSWIDPVGWTKLGVRMSSDIDQENIPTAGQDNSIYVRMSEYAGTDYDPYLSISISSSSVESVQEYYFINQFIFLFSIFAILVVLTFVSIWLIYILCLSIIE